MHLTPRLQQAIDMAARLHRNHMRRNDDVLPYVSHVFGVAWIVASYTQDEDIVIAGLLHDTIEDVEGYTYDHLAEAFGTRVADIVEGVTEPRICFVPGRTRQGWMTCKRHYLEKITQGSDASLLVSAADKMHNSRSLVMAYEEMGSAMWNKFHGSPQDTLWFYQSVADIVLQRRGTNDALAMLLQHDVSRLATSIQKITDQNESFSTIVSV